MRSTLQATPTRAKRVVARCTLLPLTTPVVDQGQEATIQAQLRGKESVITHLRSESAKKEGEMVVLQQRLDEKDSQIFNLKAMVEEGKDEMARLTTQLEKAKGRQAQLVTVHSQALSMVDSVLAKHQPDPPLPSPRRSRLASSVRRVG